MSRSLPSRMARFGLAGLGTGVLVVLAASPALAEPPLDAVDDTAQLTASGDGTATVSLLANDIGQDGAPCDPFPPVTTPPTQPNCLLVPEPDQTGDNGTLFIDPLSGEADYATLAEPDSPEYAALIAAAPPCTGIIDTFEYTISGTLPTGLPDPTNTDTGTITITIGTALRGVDAGDDTGETVGTAPIGPSSLLTNDCDQTGATPANSGAADGDGLPNVVAALVTPPANGTAVVNPDGTATYTANAGFAGTDSFTYSITTQDAGEPRTDTATVTITVAAEPAPPTTPPPGTPPPGTPPPGPPPGGPGQPAPPQLSNTGYEALPTALAAFGLLLVGSALLMVSRRRSERPNH